MLIEEGIPEVFIDILEESTEIPMFAGDIKEVVKLGSIFLSINRLKFPNKCKPYYLSIGNLSIKSIANQSDYIPSTDIM